MVAKVLSKTCAVCDWHTSNRPGEPIPEHNCMINHEGSSKSMESKACVELLVQLHAKGATVRRLVGDDDSTFRANTKHSYKG